MTAYLNGRPLVCEGAEARLGKPYKARELTQALLVDKYSCLTRRGRPGAQLDESHGSEAMARNRDLTSMKGGTAAAHSI